MFADIHVHGLFGVDDGPESEQEMYQMVRAAYEDGTRQMCLTPHFYPAYFGQNREAAEAAFEKLYWYAQVQWPDLRLCLGSEVRCGRDAADWLWDGVCRTLNGTRYVLVDFPAGEKPGRIVRGVERLLDAGYIPVLAHVERYRELPLGAIRRLYRKGVWMQMDVRAPFGGYGLWSARRSRLLLHLGLIDLAASDSHDGTRHPPRLSRGYAWVAKKYGKAYADLIFWENAQEIFGMYRKYTK